MNTQRTAGMSAQHTPGPWSLGCGYGMHGVEVVGNAGNRKVCGVIGVDRDVHDKDGRKVACVADPEGAANARLIVGTPGEDGIKADTFYRVNASGQLEELTP